MPGSIPDEFISDLIARSDIVSLIERHIRLQKAGREYKACCPFHEERTPSFYVSPAKQFYHCFGCGKSGNVVSFLMDYSNLPFPDAIEELASIAGVEMPKKAGSYQANGDFQLMLKLMDEVQDAYRNHLMRGKDADDARAYLKSRKISPETAERFGLGYAPNSWDFILSRFGKTDQAKRLLHKCGLTVTNEQEKTYDRFRNRLMFPIMDRRNRVIAFGGRVIGEGEPKYLNSPETPLFNKSGEMFGLNHALSAARAADKILVVEGYTDVLALFQYGIKYAVATLGTATTELHVRRLFQTASHIVFCFDGDTAGRKAAWRALEAVLPMMVDGKMASFMFLPQGHDPDSLIRDEGAAGFEGHMSEATSIERFIFSSLASGIDMKRFDARAKLIEKFKPIFAKLPQGALRVLMIKHLSSMTELDVRHLETTYAVASRPSAKHQRSVPKGPIAIDLPTKALAVLIQNPQLAVLIDCVEELASAKVASMRLLGEISEVLEDVPELTTAGLVERFRGSESHDRFSELVSFDHRISDANLESEFRGIISKIRTRLLDEKIDAEMSKLLDSNNRDMRRARQLVNDLLASKGLS